MPLGTISKTERYHLTVRQEETDRPPIWIMRQAGRYMPEYMALRKQHSFLDFCHKPDVSARATILALEILDIDIMIVFNDILVPLQDMGLSIDFPNGGPVIANPIRTVADLDRFPAATFDNPSVAQSLRMIKTQAGTDVPVLGFCGAPYTLALYAIEGAVTRNHDAIKRMMFETPDLLHEVLSRLATTAANYLIAQVEQGGADGVQVFESWGSDLAMNEDYEEFAAHYQREVIARFRRACPGVPLHLFVRGSAGKIASMQATGADVLGIDWSLSLADARAQTPLPLQGNLDPAAMLVTEMVPAAFHRMITGFDWRRGWIANLGHGITPQGNVNAARAFVQCVQSLAGKS